MSTVGGPRLSTIPSFINTYSLDFDGDGRLCFCASRFFK